MKKIYITNEIYTLDKVQDNHQLVKVEYLFKGNETIIYYAYELDEKKTPQDYLDSAKHDFHKFKKTKKSLIYSYKYYFLENR